jgi:putative transposase
MRKEQFVIGGYVHVFNRGNRKQEIVRTTADKWRFLQALRFFNDSHSSLNILRDLSRAKSWLKPGINQPSSIFETGWPPNWPQRDPLVKILCYCLIPNHFHLLLKEIKEGGISKFMQKLGVGYTNYFNLKHQEVGRVFQGPYKARIVNEEIYLKYLSVYIQVINVLELFPGGLPEVIKNLNEAMKFVDNYSFSSYPDYAGLRNSLIIDKDILGGIFFEPEDYKKFVRDSIPSKNFDQLLGSLKLD